MKCSTCCFSLLPFAPACQDQGFSRQLCPPVQGAHKNPPNWGSGVIKGQMYASPPEVGGWDGMVGHSACLGNPPPHSFPCIWSAAMAAQTGVFYPLNITWALGCAEIISMGKPGGHCGTSKCGICEPEVLSLLQKIIKSALPVALSPAIGGQVLTGVLLVAPEHRHWQATGKALQVTQRQQTGQGKDGLLCSPG